MAEALISILIPTCNRPDLLDRCLRKCLAAIPENQDDFEIIVGDDSNRDENRKIVDAFSKVWTGRITYFGNPHSLGQQGNFNSLIRVARAEFIQFVHDDDYLLPNSGAVLLETARSRRGNPRPIRFSVKIVEFDEGERRSEILADQELSPSEAVSALVSKSSFVRFPSMFVPRQSYLQAGLFDETAKIPDWPTWLELGKRFGFTCSSKITCAYTIHESAGTNKMFTEAYVVDLADLLARFAPFTGLSEQKNQKLIGMFLGKYILAGAIRALQSKKWIDLHNRLSLFDLKHISPYDIPWRWRLLRLFLRAISFLKKQ